MGKPKYKVKCAYCGRQFTVPDLATPVPKHPSKSGPKPSGIPYIPCAGSGLKGAPLKPHPSERADINLT